MATWRIAAVLVTAGSVALVALVAACGGGSLSNSANGGAGGVVRVANTIATDPITPLTVDTDTTRVMDLVWTGLVRYDDKLRPYNTGAKSITTKQATTFDITLNDDYTFSDGTPATADSFIDSWTYAAYTPHALQSASLFSVIHGYDAVNPPAPAGSSNTPAPAEIAYRQPEHPYTVPLLDSVPGGARGLSPTNRSRADTANPAAVPAASTGCPFRSRCWKAAARHETETPEPRSSGTADRLVRCYYPEGTAV